MPKQNLEESLSAPKRKSEADFLAPVSEAPSTGLDPSAPRKHKSITVTFNEFEYRQLEYVSSELQRGKVDTLRFLVGEKKKELNRNH